VLIVVFQDTVTVHKNSVFIVTPPNEHSKPAPSDSQPETPAVLAGRDVIPWRGASVIITKPLHPRKGQRGVVDNVLLRQNTLSGLGVTVRFESYSPGTLSQPEVFDYDDVLESTWVFPFFMRSMKD
jgi:hypothetical protein